MAERSGVVAEGELDNGSKWETMMLTSAFRVGLMVWSLVLGSQLIVTAAPSTRKPLLTIEHRPYDQPQRQGAPLAIQARIQSPAGVKKAIVYCRTAGARTFTALPMRSRGDQYQAVVPDWMTASQGLEYYITATDGLGHSTSQGFVGFPLTVRLFSGRSQTRQERLQVLDNTLRVIRQRQVGPGGRGRDSLLPSSR